MGPRRKKRFFWPIVIAPLMAIGLIVTLVALRPAQDRALANYWRDEIASMPDAQVATAIEQLKLTGDASIPVLTELLASPRASVAGSARRALLDEVDRWMLLPAEREALKLALLANSLAENIESYSPVANGLAAELAEQILMRPIDGRAIDRMQLFADCDRVLQSASTGSVLSADTWRQQLFDPLGEAQPSAYVVRPSTSRMATVESDFSAVPQVPGGGLSIDAAQVPRSPPSHVHALPPGTPGRREPGLLHKPATRVSTLPVRPPQPPRELPISGAAPPRHVRPRHVGTATHIGDASAGSRSVEQVQAIAEARLPIAQRRAITVMRLLHAKNQAQVQSAIHELKRRGMGPAELQLARALTDADPRVRRSVVETLPTIPAVNARPWLLTLSEDRDADVRLPALALMATSGDPQLTSRALEIAGRDNDPRILAIAKRLKGRREKR